MKTIKSMLIAALLLVGTGAFANNTSTPKTEPSTINEEISQLLENPSFQILSDFEVLATLTVNAEGELVVLSVSSENDQIKRYVKSRLNYQKLQNVLKEGAMYKVPIRLVSE